MELQVTQENFVRALQNASRVANNKTPLPILNNVLLRTDNNILLVASTNLEIASSTYIGAKVSKQGEVTVPARLLTDFISNLPKGSIDLIVKNNQLTIESASYKSTINGASSDEFPELPAISEGEVVKYNISLDDFKQSVSQTIITASTDATRPILTGVYWHTHENYLYLAATDGYRLSERKLLETKSEINSIIPTTTLQEVLRTLSDDVTEVEVIFSDTEVHFKLNQTTITSRLIDGSFPDYRQLIPKQSETSLEIKKQDFSRVIKIASIFARESGGSVTLDVDKDKSILSIHSIASELGENTSEANINNVSDNGRVTLNSKYLNDALSVIQGDDIEIKFNGKLSPVILDSVGDSDYIHIVMPLKS